MCMHPKFQTPKPKAVSMCETGYERFTSFVLRLNLVFLLGLVQSYTEGPRGITPLLSEQLLSLGADLVCHPPRVRGIASSCYLSMASRTQKCPMPLQVLSVAVTVPRARKRRRAQIAYKISC